MDPVRDPEGIEIEYLNRTGVINGRNVIEIGCGDGRITMGNLYRYVHDKVLDEGFQEPMKWD